MSSLPSLRTAAIAIFTNALLVVPITEHPFSLHAATFTTCLREDSYKIGICMLHVMRLWNTNDKCLIGGCFDPPDENCWKKEFCDGIEQSGSRFSLISFASLLVIFEQFGINNFKTTYSISMHGDHLPYRLHTGFSYIHHYHIDTVILVAISSRPPPFNCIKQLNE